MTQALTKADIVDVAYEGSDRTRGEVKKHVESLLAIMKTAIVRNLALLISGFGKFETYAKEARKGRNPHTSEAITLEPRKVVVFRLSKKFRDEMN